jgi:hypothetical protein
MKVLRSGSGLGDSLYARVVADYFVSTGAKVTVKSDYPSLFAGSRAIVVPFTRENCNVVAHYSKRKHIAETNQWQDICISAGIPPIPLSFKWEVKNKLLVQDLRAMANGKRIVMINGGRHPMGRKDGYAREMLPSREAFAAVLRSLDDCFIVEVGKGEDVYPLHRDVDLTNRTIPSDLLDIATISRGLVGQCSFMIPLAEALDKPLMVVWAAAGLQSKTEFIRQCTPGKILSKESSRYVMDDWEISEITQAADAFRSVL